MNKDLKKYQLFQRFKNECLSKDDLSRKGSIDEPIRQLVEIINDIPFYYTTSTCSGRITIIGKPHELSAIKKGSQFFLNSHDSLDICDLKQVITSSIETTTNDDDRCLWLKFEPFIMHIQSYDLDRAKALLNIALGSGCRNSGITLGKPEKFMVAIRSTSSMEVPLFYKGQFNLDEKYLEFLGAECNRRLTDNFARLGKLQEAIEKDLTTPSD